MKEKQSLQIELKIIGSSEKRPHLLFMPTTCKADYWDMNQ